MEIYYLTMGWDRVAKRTILSKYMYFLNSITLRQFLLKLNNKNKNLKVVLKHWGGKKEKKYCGKDNRGIFLLLVRLGQK